MQVDSIQSVSCDMADDDCRFTEVAGLIARGADLHHQGFREFLQWLQDSVAVGETVVGGHVRHQKRRNPRPMPWLRRRLRKELLHDQVDCKFDFLAHVRIHFHMIRASLCFMRYQ